MPLSVRLSLVFSLLGMAARRRGRSASASVNSDDDQDSHDPIYPSVPVSRNSACPEFSGLLATNSSSFTATSPLPSNHLLVQNEFVALSQTVSQLVQSVATLTNRIAAHPANAHAPAHFVAPLQQGPQLAFPFDNDDDVYNEEPVVFQRPHPVTNDLVSYYLIPATHSSSMERGITSI